MFCEGVKVPVGGEGYDSHISVILPIKEDKLFVSSRRCAAGRKNEFKRSLRLGMLGRSGGRSSGSLDDFSKGFHIRYRLVYFC